MTVSENIMNHNVEQDLLLFSKRLPLRRKLQEIFRMLDHSDGPSRLDLGTDNCMMSYQLRKGGGRWETLASNDDHKEAALQVVKDNVKTITGDVISYKKKAFDVIVVMDYLAKVTSDDAFIRECHRIMNPGGKLIVSVSRVKTYSFIVFLRRLFGLVRGDMRLARGIYTEQELFLLLKDGFDVHHIRSYSHFFVELVDTFVRLKINKLKVSKKSVTDSKIFFGVASVFYWFASQLDLLLFWTKGYNLVAVAKRRPWRPRNAPVLVDGRSISEAVLSPIH